MVPVAVPAGAEKERFREETDPETVPSAEITPATATSVSAAARVGPSSAAPLEPTRCVKEKLPVELTVKSLLNRTVLEAET